MYMHVLYKSQDTACGSGKLWIILFLFIGLTVTDHLKTTDNTIVTCIPTMRQTVSHTDSDDFKTPDKRHLFT